MDTALIADFLKKLRQQAGYTQAELGKMIDVTDKAISRWENGSGFPEISNLLALSRIYGISVDDILTCNQSVLKCDYQETQEQKEIASDASAANMQTRDKKNAQTDAQQEIHNKNNRVLERPSQKFLTVLFFAFLVLGTAVLTRATEYYDFTTHLSAECETEKVVFYALFAILALATAVTELIGKIIPYKVYKILSMVVAAAFAADAFLLAITQLILRGTEGIYQTLGAFTFTFLFAIRLLYVMYDFSENAKTKNIFSLAALGTSATCAIFAVIFGIIIFNTGFNIEDYSFYIFRGIIFASVVALLFTLAQKINKWINILTAVVMIPAGIMCTFMFSEILDIPFSTYPFMSTMWMGLAVCAPVFVTISFLFENSKLELTATRTAIILAIGSCVPFAINAIDIFGVNASLYMPDLAAAAFVRISVLAAAIIFFAKSFRFTQIYEFIKERKQVNEN